MGRPPEEAEVRAWIAKATSQMDDLFARCCDCSPCDLAPFVALAESWLAQKEEIAKLKAEAKDA